MTPQRDLSYTATPILLNPYRNPKPAFSVRCPSLDGYKTRAARLIGDGLRCKWSRRLGYTVSPAKFAKFEKLFAEGWDASVMRPGVMFPPPPRS